MGAGYRRVQLIGRPPSFGAKGGLGEEGRAKSITASRELVPETWDGRTFLAR